MNDLKTLFESYLAKNAEQAELTRTMLERIEQDRADTQALFNRVAEMAFMSDVDQNALQSFFARPYDLVPRGKDSYILIVPKFIPFSAGWRILANEKSEYNHFEITRFTHLLNPLPDWLAEKANYTAPTWGGVVEGNTLIVTHGDPEKIASKFGKAVATRHGNKLTLKPASRFDVLRRMIKEDGILPFAPAPIPRELLRNPDDYKSADPALGLEKFKLRAWQQKTFTEEFLEWSRIGLFAWGQTGKSYLGLEGCAALRGQKIIFTYRKNLRDQWLTRRLPLLSDEARAEVIVDSYHNLHKYKNSEFSLVILDECHHVPANLCIEAAYLKTQALIGMSASPVREDGNEDLIVALTGKPVGLDWVVTDTQKPNVHVWVVKDEAAKFDLTEQLVAKRIKGKTFVFSWRIEIGEKICKRLDIPFITGKTKNALQIIDDNDIVGVSSVADEGLSAPVDRIVEVSFQYGGRAAVLQRYLRAANETGTKGEFHSIVTPEDLQKYGKRYSIFEYNGLEIEYHDTTARAERVSKSDVRQAPMFDTPRTRVPSSTRIKPRVGGMKASAVASKPKTEIDTILENRAVQRALDTAYAEAGKKIRGEKILHRILALGWEAPVSTELLIIGGQISKGRAWVYDSAFKIAVKHQLMARVGDGYQTNRARLNQLVKASERFSK